MNTDGTPLPRRKHLHRIPVWLSQEQRVIYFVTACCMDRRRVFTEATVVRIGTECLQRIEARQEWKVWNVCFMPDHVHLLISPMREREQSLSEFMQAWKSCVVLRLKRIGVANPVWQNEFFDRLLRSDEKLEEKWKYIRENPVRAKLCVEPEDYPYSGEPQEILNKIGPGNT